MAIVTTLRNHHLANYKPLFRIIAMEQISEFKHKQGSFTDVQSLVPVLLFGLVNNGLRK
jgi:hypothetical protein